MAVAADWVAHNARRFGCADALESADTGELLSWAQLEDVVARTAGLLRAEFDVGRGDRVAVLAHNNLRTFIVQYACMRLGALLVPLNWRLSVVELESLCADCRPYVIVHDQAWRQTAIQIAEGLGVSLLSWGDPGSEHDFDRLAEHAVPVSDEGLRQVEDPIHILYTSGTTGLPKGALVTAETLSWHTLNIAAVNEVTGPGDRLLLPLPLFHAGGLNTLANPILMSGGCVSVLSRFEPAQCLELLGDPDRGYTHFGSVPTMYQMIADLPAFAAASFPAIKHMQVAGGVASHRLLDAWQAKGVTLQTQYGGTEMGPGVAAMPKSSARQKAGSCGFPVIHTRVRLVSADGQDVDPGQLGEVWISGPSVTPGYFNNQRATSDAFDGDWFRTGDVARLDDDGYLYLVDRQKDMYKSGGENVFPAEVERILLEHPDIAEVVVIGVPDTKWGETGLAVLVPRTGASVTLHTITEYCAGRIARYKVPSSVHLVDALPRNATGKVVKADLRKRYADVGPIP